jgi:hypothetical protein
MKKYIAIGMVVLAVIGIVLLPLPHKSKQTMYGAEITPEGEIITYHKYLVEVLEWDYLFREDEHIVNITFTNGASQPPLLAVETMKEYWSAQNNGSYFTTFYHAYRSEEDDFVSGSLAITKDYKHFLMEGQKENYYVGSVCEDYSVNDIMSFFESNIIYK